MSGPPTTKGVHDKLRARPLHTATGFDTRKTLRLRVEFVRQLRRRRTQLTFGLLLVLPIIIAIAFKFGGAAEDARSGGGANGSGLVSLASHGASNFALFIVFASVGFLLVVVVALFCGDTVAAEANWSSLRYLLALPVPRARLLRQKLIVSLTLAFGSNLLLPLWSFVVGGLFFGWAPARSPLSGDFTLGESISRLLIIVGYACIQSLVVAALAFLLSTMVDNPLGAVGGAVMLVVVSNILDQITALPLWIRHLLPTEFQYAWLDAVGRDIIWDDMLRGIGLVLVYAAIFLGIAWLRFDRKDITS